MSRLTTSARDMIGSLGPSSVGVVVTDPPWKLDGGGRFSTVADYPLMEPGDVARDLEGLKGAMKPGAHLYLFAPAGEVLHEVFTAFTSRGWGLVRTLAWDKGHAAGLGAYRNAWEPVVLLSNGPARPFTGTKCRHSSLLRAPPPPGRTRKPWQLYAIFLEMSSSADEMAADPYCGSNPLERAVARMGRGQPWVASDVLTPEQVADSVKNRQWRQAGRIGRWGTYDRAESDAVQTRLEGPA